MSSCKQKYDNTRANKRYFIDCMSSSESYTSSRNLSGIERQDELLVVISHVLLEMTRLGDKQQWPFRWFCSPSGRAAPITLEAYVARLFKYGQFNRDSFLSALIYLDRLISSGFTFNSDNIHRVFLIAAIIASKFFEDEVCDNKFYAIVGGIGKPELNILELQFLLMLDWNVNVSTLEYDQYSTALRYKITKEVELKNAQLCSAESKLGNTHSANNRISTSSY